MSHRAADALIRLDIAPPEAIQSLHTFTGRALCHQVGLTDGRQVFVKQDRDGARESDAAAEARTVQALRAAGLTGPTPEVLATGDGVAAYRGYQDRADLLEQVTLGTAVATSLGRALAQLHHTVADLRPTGPFARSSLDWTILTPATLALHPSGYRETWARCASALEPLRRLSRTWAGDAVIHGDIKSDNILSDGSGVVIIDWETAGIGDAMWDLGCLVGDRVWVWVRALPLTPGLDVAGWISEAPTPLASISDDLRTALRAYAAPVDATRICGYAGVFLLQRALAEGMQSRQLSKRSLLTTHLATQFIVHPERTAEILL